MAINGWNGVVSGHFAYPRRPREGGAAVGVDYPFPIARLVRAPGPRLSLNHAMNQHTAR